MNSIVTQRFLQCHEELLAREKVKSRRQFALSLDYLPQSFSEIIKGRRDAPTELLRKGIMTYNMSPNFLFKGEHPMFGDQSQPQSSSNDKIVTVVTDNRGNEKISYVPVAAQAGYGDNIHSQEYFRELFSFSLPDAGLSSGTFRCFDVAGDSMEPTLLGRDKIVCRFLEKEDWASSICDNHVYVIVTKREILVKRVVNKINESGHIELFSDNTFYKPYPLEVQEILEVWYVKLKMSPFLPAPSQQRVVEHELDLLRMTMKDQSEVIRGLNSTVDKLLKQYRSRV